MSRPSRGELQTISIGPDAAAGQAPSCSAAPCIDPDFAALGGPTASSLYGSASSFAATPVFAWTANFAGGNVDSFNLFKTFDSYVRAVRGGSCN